ncbi:hypothetical protein [Bacillus sp. T33-2]|nr:hypothetical protein [Bacillus sp. T33-2]
MSKDIEKQIKQLEKKKQSLVNKGAWMAIYILDAKIETLKDKLLPKS